MTNEIIVSPVPDNRRTVIRSVHDVEALHVQLLGAAERTVAWLRGFDGSPLQLLTTLRFQTVGHDPLTGEALNLIEQLNQTFTILVTLRAVERLIVMHPEANGFRLALATSSGRDIESVEPDLVAAEVFSATHPGSNQKLKKDIARLTSGAPPLCILCRAEVHLRSAASIGNCPRSRGALCRSLTLATGSKKVPIR